MIVAAALCPGPPLLIRELTGATVVEQTLRLACVDAVSELAAAGPEVIVVVGVAERSGVWPADSELDLAVFAPGPGLRRPAPAAAPGAAVRAAADLPTSLGVGSYLLGAAAWGGERILEAVAADAAPADCAALGADIAAMPGRVALLAMADGSARRSKKAPGYLDERSAGFDDRVRQAVEDGDMEALAGLDAAFARELMAAGRPACQVLAGALAGRKVASEIRYNGDPFGVAYLVASLRVGGEQDG
jgi:hypothetical protein